MRSRSGAAFAAGLLVGLVAVASTPVMADELGGSIHMAVVERATTDVVIDVGEAGDTVGDMLGFGNDLYDDANSAIVGRDQGQCFRSNPGLSWECTWTNIFDDGAITVQGPFYDDLRDSDFAITGGTGVYAGASGSMTLHSRDELGAELDFLFDIRLDADHSEMDEGSDE